MVALIGDAEMDEGNIFEALLEGWKHGLRNTWWIVDYNRQSLDAVVHEGLWARLESMFRNFGWDVVILKHGVLQQAAFVEPGGEQACATWIDACPNQLYAALTFQGGAAWRKRLRGRARPPGRRLGADRAALRRRARSADVRPRWPRHGLAARGLRGRHGSHDRPVCFIAYTIKGFGLPLAGHKDNHSGLMNPAQVEVLRKAMGMFARAASGSLFEGLDISSESELRGVPRPTCRSSSSGRRRLEAPKLLPCPRAPRRRLRSLRHVDAAGVRPADARDRQERRAASPQRIVTTSPDVTVSTNLGAWVNRRGIFAREGLGGYVQGGAHSVDLQLDLLAGGAASSSSASPR